MYAGACCWWLRAAASWLCLSSKVMLLGLLAGGPGVGAAVADDNRGEVDVVGLITHSEGRTQSLLLSDAATLSASALTSPHFHFLETVAILSEEYAKMTPNYSSYY